MLVVIGVCLCVCAAVNVNRPTSFLDAAQQEKMREREALASGLMFSRDRLIEMIPVIYALNQHGSSTFTNHGQTGNGHLCQSLKCCPNISVCMAVLLVKVVVLINSYWNSVYVFSSDVYPFHSGNAPLSWRCLVSWCSEVQRALRRTRRLRERGKCWLSSSSAKLGMYVSLYNYCA